MRTETRLTQSARNPASQHGFVNTPVYRGSTVVFPSYDALINRRAEFHYGTDGTPTIAALENAWSELTGAAGTVLSPSGLGAVTLALLTTLKSGDHLLMTDSVYHPTRQLCGGLLAKMGITTTYYDPLIGAGIESLIRPETAVIFLESPGSQTFEVQDVPAITAVAKR
ncbi:PLP-dependent transferase, partial [Klebsiella pasteurii]|uniref:PLP-dependent transferase n=1 Tax=Klebsiella pasteurii TaxID=2587529 RepID=UPI0032D9BEFC